MAGIFKAYDVRGIYPTEIDEAIARKIGHAFRNVLDADDLAMRQDAWWSRATCGPLPSRSRRRSSKG